MIFWGKLLHTLSFYAGMTLSVLYQLYRTKILFLLFFSGSTGEWTQDFARARQVLYLLNRIFGPFSFTDGGLAV
jgi:hypothetical protein